MDAARSPYRLSVEDYLEGERDAPNKHEYVCGEVFALAGTSGAHNTVTLNLASALTPAARKRAAASMPAT